MEIGISAFADTGIKEIILPASLKKISVTALYEIEKITFMGNMESWQELLLTSRGQLHTPVKCLDGVFEENTVLKGRLRYELNPDGLGYTVVGIGSYVATHLTVPGSYEGLPVTNVAARAFAGAPLKSISFEGNPKLAKRVFNGAFNLETVDLENLTELCEETFGGAHALKRVRIGTTLKEIPDSCFMSCSDLESVYINANVKRIGTAAFGFCEDLVDVYVENGVEEIGDKAFYCCESLRSIFVPLSVEKMGENEGRVFFNCSPALEIDCEAESQPRGWIDGWNEQMGDEPDFNPKVYKVNFGKKR